VENQQKTAELVTQTKFSKKDNKKIFPSVPYFSSLMNEIDAHKHNPIEQPKLTGGQMNAANDTSQSSTAEQDKVVRDSFRELFSRDLGQMLSMSLDLTIKEFAVNPY
jgi:hypothetical protein